MKIGLVSLPLTWNYGGILQHYALQKVLENYGHEVHIITIRKDRKNLFLNSLVKFKWQLIKLIGNKKLPLKHKLLDVERFKQREMSRLTDSFFSLDEVCDYLHANEIDTLVVGSDQIWNKDATHSLDVSFLNFNYPARRFSYAASFAKNSINYKAEELVYCSKQLESFDGISVREKSGVDILKNSLSTYGVHVLDPTLLLDANLYPTECKELQTPDENYLFSYVLDKNEDKDNFREVCCRELDLTNLDFIEHDGYRGVEAWIKALANSEFIVTDSFHGMCFAVIFNKNFIVVANKERGLDRFYSLLKTLNLENRLVLPEDLSRYNFNNDDSSINWSEVNDLLKREQVKSREFIKNI
jgi:hypothetical protein